MSDIIWGPEIAVDGKRPEWLDNAEEIVIRSVDGYSVEGRCDAFSGSDWDWWSTSADEDRIVAIRLPADHPHYATLSTPTAPNTTAGYSDEVVERMAALVRRVASTAPWLQAMSSDLDAIDEEARAIVALLPEPVDADVEEANRVEAEVAGGQAFDCSIDLQRAIALAAIKRGRALAAGDR